MKYSKLQATLLAAVLIIAIGLSGCYTLLKHPRVAESEPQEDYSNCAACHGQFVHPSPYDMYYYRGVWSEYYFFPWWYNTYWEKDYMDYFYTAPERNVIRRNVLRQNEPGVMKGIGTTRGRLKSPSTLEQKKSTDIQKSSGVKVKERKSVHETTSPKRNIIRHRSVKEKRKENPKKK